MYVRRDKYYTHGGTMLFKDFLRNLNEVRNPNYSYEDLVGKTIVSLESHDSAIYTSIAKKVERISILETEIKALKEEVKEQARENIAGIFNSSDAINTRVIETVSFILTLSKDPSPTYSPKYKEILDTLSQQLTPELIIVLEKLKSEMITVTQKTPSLKIVAKEDADENLVTKISNLFWSAINRWTQTYDRKLDYLKKLATSL